jgi:hypothetical protein
MFLKFSDSFKIKQIHPTPSTISYAIVAAKVKLY